MGTLPTPSDVSDANVKEKLSLPLTVRLLVPLARSSVSRPAGINFSTV